MIPKKHVKVSIKSLQGYIQEVHDQDSIHHILDSKREKRSAGTSKSINNSSVPEPQ